MSIISNMGQYFKLGVVAGNNLSITPYFLERPSATTVKYRYEIVPDTTTSSSIDVVIDATNTQNSAELVKDTFTIPTSSDVEDVQIERTSVSGTDSYVATFSIDSIESPSTGSLLETSINVPAYIPPVTLLDFNNKVTTLHSYPDGSLLCGGTFTLYGATSANGIIKLQPDGNIDTSFTYGSGFSASSGMEVRDIEVQSDGKIVCVGKFESYNGTTAGSIVRLNADGSIDSSFNYGSGFKFGASLTNVDAVKQLSDGRLVVAGYFDTYNGVATNTMTILLSTGTKDSSFDAGTGLTHDGSTIIGARALTIEDGTDKIFVGGDFGYASGIQSGKLAKYNLDGSVDTSFSVGAGFTGGHAASSVYTIKLHGSTCYVGGQFGAYKGTSTNRIARLTSTGDLDANFDVGLGFNAAAGTVLSLDVDSIGNVYCGGSFTTFNSTTINRIIKLSSTGDLDASFDMGTGFNNNVWNVLIEASGIILVSGVFTTYKSSPVSEVVRLSITGDLLT